MTTPGTLRGFAIALPDGFVGLPTDQHAGQQPSSVAHGLEQLFGLPRGDRSAAEMARWFSMAGQVVGAGGMEFAAIGFFHSPEDLRRPVYAMVTGTRMAADFESADEAIAGMQGLFEAQGSSSEVAQLTAGQALLVTTERSMTAPADDQNETTVHQREITAWIPDSTGSVLGVVAVSTGSWRDWAHVHDLAMRVFGSVEWEPVS